MSDVDITLRDLLESMDIPEFRRNIENRANLEWLGRNLFIKNSNHPNFPEVIRILEQLGIDIFA